MPQQPARPNIGAGQALGLAIFLATAAILSALTVTRVFAGLGSLQGIAAAFSTGRAAVAAFGMLVDAVDLWVRGRRMTVHDAR